MIIDTRKAAGLTQKKLACKSGIRQSNISRIESGSCVPNLHTPDQLAKAMGKQINISFK
jgi:transcriptional regulator with XRE-family HTH domain